MGCKKTDGIANKMYDCWHDTYCSAQKKEETEAKQQVESEECEVFLPCSVKKPVTNKGPEKTSTNNAEFS